MGNMQSLLSVLQRVWWRYLEDDQQGYADQFKPYLNGYVYWLKQRGAVISPTAYRGGRDAFADGTGSDLRHKPAKRVFARHFRLEVEAFHIKEGGE
jgi:hypothetical protein